MLGGALRPVFQTSRDLLGVEFGAPKALEPRESTEQRESMWRQGMPA
jgi:hypothetical protein